MDECLSNKVEKILVFSLFNFVSLEFVSYFFCGKVKINLSFPKKKSTDLIFAAYLWIIVGFELILANRQKKNPPFWQIPKGQVLKSM